MELLDNLAVGIQIRMWKTGERIRNFFKEEKGVSNVVATIILVLIVVLIIAIFWKQLQKWLNGMMQTIFGETYDNNELEKGLPK